MAARPLSPHTTRARVNPPVRATAELTPWWASVREYEAAMDEATATPIAPPKVLERSGLISRRKQGREVLYLVETGRLDQACQAMAEVAAQWDRRLAAIKRLAEAAHAENQRTQPS